MIWFLQELDWNKNFAPVEAGNINLQLVYLLLLAVVILTS